GEQGEQGPQGEQGEPGPQGEQGEQGPQGEQGEPGPQGEQGEQGPQGEPGPQGEQGEPGAPGTDGANGLNSLVAMRASDPSCTCPWGGVRIEVGLDDDASGVLETDEVDSTMFVCHGDDGSEPCVCTPESEGECVEPLVDTDAGTDTDVAEAPLSAGNI